jgi:hypothetical protein
MANSGSVRIKLPAAVNVQVGINGPNATRSIAPLSAAGGGNIFSAWIKDAAGTDTIFYYVNHSGGDVNVPTKWLDASGAVLADTFVTVPANGMLEDPASAHSA